MSVKKWSAECRRLYGKQWIAVQLEKDERLIARIKQFAGRRWDPEHKVWLLPDTPENRDRFGLEREIIMSAWHRDGIDDFIRWLKSKRYSENTIRVYSEALSVFLKFFNSVPTEDFHEDHLTAFNNDYIVARKLSLSWQNQAVNAIKLYFGRIQGSRMRPELLHRPRTEHKLPHVLSKEEVKSILQALINLKHRMMLSVIYACGLRRGELQRLRLTDIDKDRKTLFIRQSKGNKDRVVPISPVLLEELIRYYRQYRPVTYLFEGPVAGEPYGDRSMSMVLKRAVDIAGIKKPVTLHWLRHSYATHLLEKGTDIRFIQELLGHKSTRTTEIYTHVSIRSLQQISSPFDDL